jgi:hypothetical protein
MNKLVTCSNKVIQPFDFYFVQLNKKLSMIIKKKIIFKDFYIHCSVFKRLITIKSKINPNFTP